MKRIKHLIKNIREWVLYKKKTFWVVYSKHQYWPIKYLSVDGYWTEDVREAKRYWKPEHTINIWTRTKRINLNETNS